MSTIGIDLLGSDTSPEILLEGVHQALKELPSGHKVLCFGTPNLKKSLSFSGVEWIDALEEIKMEDDPLLAVRKKRGSSLHLGIEALKEGRLSAFITTGNTGALTALARLRLPLLPGIDRPCLLATLPTMKEETAMVDVGASSHLDPDHLLQFTALGVDFLRRIKKIDYPKVALLNIGAESMKGTLYHRQLFETLKEEKGTFLFVGNVEGKEVFQGQVDLVITDGFTGNVFLKAAEGMAEFLLNEIQGSLEKSHFKQLESRFTQEVSPGAVLLGVEGIILKCHGLSNAATIRGAILRAAELSSHHEKLF